MGLHQQRSQGRVGSAHKEHQSLWDVEQVFGTPWACQTETGMGHRPPEQPRGSSTKAEPLQPGSETHSSHRGRPTDQRLSRETTGDGARDRASSSSFTVQTSALPFHTSLSPGGHRAGGCRDCAGTRQVMNGALGVTEPSVSRAAPGAPARSHRAGSTWRGQSLSFCLQHEPQRQTLIPVPSSGPA